MQRKHLTKYDIHYFFKCQKTKKRSDSSQPHKRHLQTNLKLPSYLVVKDQMICP